MNISAITYFGNKIDPFSMKNSFEAAKLEPEPIFEKTINDIKANHLKIITSIEMNLSAITSKKPSSSSKHLNPISCHG